MELTARTAAPHPRTLLLRPYRSDDAPALHALVTASLQRLSTWLPWAHAGYALDEARAFIAQGTEDWRTRSGFAFGIFDAANGQLLGGAGLNRLNRLQRSANLGYWVGSCFHDEGIASAAAACVADFGLRECDLECVEIAVAPGNHASQRVAEKLGAEFLGLVQDRIPLHGGMVSALLYALRAEPAAPGRGHRI